MPNLSDEPTHATWEQATDNVRTGGVVFEDNYPFTIVPIENVAAGYKYPIAPNSRSTLTIRVSGEESVYVEPNDDIIKFKNGNYFGIEYLGYRQVYRFVYIQGEEVVGRSTVSDLPYTQMWNDDYPRSFSVSIGGQDYPVYARELSETFVYSTDPQSYYIQYADYISLATNETIGYMWRPEFPTTLGLGQYGFVGELGYPNAQPIVDFLAGNTSSKPDYPGDPSGAGGGDGTYYTDDYDMDWPGCPGISALSLGFTSIYVPTPEIAQSIAAWLWSDDFDENIKMNYISPFDNIISLSIVPIKADDLAIPSFLRIGNVESGIECPKLPASEQYQELDMGTVNVPEKWGSFLDFNAQYYIFLPMIGFRALRPDDMVSGKISVRYWCDMLTGGVTCNIMANKPGEKNHILYTYNGNMLYGVAFSGANFMSQYNQQLAATTSGLNSAVSAVSNLASGNLAGAFSSLLGIGTAQRQYDTAKPDYGRGGNSGGNMGLFATRYPYLIRIRAIEQTPDHYKHLVGVPSQISAQLSTLSGYTEVDSVAVDTLTCPQEEKEAIYKLLKGGVYL